MKLEISIEADIPTINELLAELTVRIPARDINKTAGKNRTDSRVLTFLSEAESPDDLLKSIAAIAAKVEKNHPGRLPLNIHVRNMACSEPTQCSDEFNKPFSPVEGIRLVPWDGRKVLVPGAADILLDPALAFGTGLHPSTRLCLHFLKQLTHDRELDFSAWSVLDIGCGSGILSIAALRLGAAEALGIEIDPDAVKIARRNIVINGLTHSARIIEESWQNLTGHYNLIMANLVPSVLFKAAARIGGLLNGHGLFITAGFPESNNKKVQHLFEQYGLNLQDEFSMDGWGALLLAKR